MIVGAPAISVAVPSARLRALTIRSLPERDGVETDAFPFLADSKEWVVEDESDRATILAADPHARFFIG